MLLLLDPHHTNASIKYLIDYFYFSSSAESSACQQRRREGGCWRWRDPAWWQSARGQRQHTQFRVRSQSHPKGGILRNERPLPSYYSFRGDSTGGNMTRHSTSSLPAAISASGPSGAEPACHLSLHNLQQGALAGGQRGCKPSLYKTAKLPGMTDVGHCSNLRWIKGCWEARRHRKTSSC